MQAQANTLRHCEYAVQKIAFVPGGHLYQQFPYNDPFQNNTEELGWKEIFIFLRLATL